MMYTAVKSYKATKDDEISVTIGSVVEVLQKSQNGWWLIRYSIRLLEPRHCSCVETYN